MIHESGRRDHPQRAEQSPLDRECTGGDARLDDDQLPAMLRAHGGPRGLRGGCFDRAIDIGGYEMVQDEDKENAVVGGVWLVESERVAATQGHVLGPAVSSSRKRSTPTISGTSCVS